MGHNILIFRKIKDFAAAEFYLIQTIQHNWSRNILDLQIDSKLPDNLKPTFPSVEDMERELNERLKKGMKTKK